MPEIKSRGSTLLELVIATALMGTVFYIATPIFFQFGGIFRDLSSKSLLKDRNRVFGAMEHYMISAGRDKVIVINTKNDVSFPATSRLEKITSKDGEGDGVYIEIENWCVSGGKLVRKNEIHIFRFDTGSLGSSLTYIPTATGRVGNFFGILRLGREEILIPRLIGGKFKKEGKNIVVTYNSGNREERVEFVIE